MFRVAASTIMNDRALAALGREGMTHASPLHDDAPRDWWFMSREEDMSIACAACDGSSAYVIAMKHTFPKKMLQSVATSVSQRSGMRMEAEDMEGA